MDYAIREARETDLHQIERLEHQCFSVPWTEEMLRSQLDPERNLFLAAAAGEEILGYIGLMYVLDEGYLSNVAVRPDCRRQGIAEALLSALECRAREKALSFLTLEVRAGNTPAIALYEKRGFRSVGRRKNYYEKPLEDAVLMTLFFQDKIGG